MHIFGNNVTTVFRILCEKLTLTLKVVLRCEDDVPHVVAFVVLADGPAYGSGVRPPRRSEASSVKIRLLAGQARLPGHTSLAAMTNETHLVTF